MFDPNLPVFPPAFVVRLPDGPAARWVESSIEFALSTTKQVTPLTAISTRLPELLLIEVLRVHLADAPVDERGLVAVLRDPVPGPAIARLHTEPQRKWTVSGLAAQVAVSRSVLDARFREVLGRSPIRYLTEWRMHLAQDLLLATDLAIAAIGRQVGYDSEEAFSRAFKRGRGLSRRGAARLIKSGRQRDDVIA